MINLCVIKEKWRAPRSSNSSLFDNSVSSELGGMACVCSDSGGATNNQESVNILIELAAWECNSKYFRSLMRSISASFDPPPTPPPNHFTGCCCYCWPWLYCNHPIRCQFPNQLRSFTFYMIDRHPFHRSISLSPWLFVDSSVGR